MMKSFQERVLEEEREREREGKHQEEDSSSSYDEEQEESQDKEKEKEDDIQHILTTPVFSYEVRQPLSLSISPSLSLFPLFCVLIFSPLSLLLSVDWFQMFFSYFLIS